MFGCGAEDCTALTSGTCLMDEHIMILIINPYYDLRSVQFMYVSDSSHFPIPPTRQPGHGRPLRPQKAPHTCTTSEYLINLPPLVQSWIPPSRTVTFWRSFRALASDSASYKRFAFLRLSPPSNRIPVKACLPLLANTCLPTEDCKQLT